MLGDCLERMKEIEAGSVDAIVTSPPYDNLRAYRGGEAFDFERIADEIVRIVAPGGVVVWIVNDETRNWGETGTSFRQALHFQSLGLAIFDTMIYAKSNPMPCGSPRRYLGVFEFMFVFSRGRPRTSNIRTEPCKSAGAFKHSTRHRDHGKELRPKWKPGKPFNDEKPMGNIWYYPVGCVSTGHPAPFPLALATDHIESWTNPGDIVCDPFMGSGTTGIACLNTNRRFIGIERDPSYFDIASRRIADAQSSTPLLSAPCPP